MTALNTSRLQALFAYLILHPTAHFRYQLAYQFWPDSSEAQARTNLRNLVHLLRQALPDFDRYIQADAQTLRWREDAPYELDVREFERLLAVPPGSSLDRDKLDCAVTLYRGDLLERFYDEWIAPERERLRRAYLAALEALVEVSEKTRDYPAAIQYSRRLIQEDPLHSAANNHLIRLHALAGDQPAALKAYQAYADRLERELGIHPDQETQDLYARLKKTVRQENQASTRSSRPLMIGRQTEWGRLQAIWQTAAAGSPQAVFITGEAGIGKTRLVEELAQWASRQGIRAAAANCFPAEGSLPYAPVVAWLRSQPLPRLDKTWLTEISRLLPEVLLAYPKLTQPKPLTEPWQRQRMFEALAKALQEEGRPSLLFIEDIHWCDQDTLEWLHYLLRYNPGAPVLLVATERREETAVLDHPLKKLQNALIAEDRYFEIKLKPLNEAECIQLATQVAVEGLHEALKPEIAAQIFQETEGNPLFIVEMVRLGHPLQAQAQSSRIPVTFSDKVQSLLKSRIDQLNAPTRELACLAATLGREFRLDVLRQASGLEETGLVMALNELLLRQIVHEQTPEQYDFTHDKLRQAVLLGLSSAHQRLLHRRAAEAYLHLAWDATQSSNPEIARHYEAAGLALPAIQHYRLAAESAASLFSTVDAIRNLERAIELAKTLGLDGENGISTDEYAELLQRMGALLALDGKYPQAQSHFEQALARSPSRSGLFRSQLYRKLSDALTAQYLHAEAHAAMDQAEGALPPSVEVRTLEENQEWLQIQLARTQLFYWQNIPDQMEVLLQKISPVVGALGRVDQQSVLLSQQVMFRLRRERYRLSDETVNLSRRRMELTETLNDPHALAIAQFQYGFNLLFHGDLIPAREWLTRGLEGTARVGARLWQLRCLTYLSIVNRKLNDLAAVREQVPQVLELALSMREYTYHGIGLANLGWLAWRDGDALTAEKLSKEAIEDWINIGGDTFHGLAYWVLLAVALSHHDLLQAESYTRYLLDPRQKYQPVLEPAANLLNQALLACQAQDADAASALFNQAVAEARVTGEL